MAFFAVFDEWSGHRKAQAAGLHGRALWLEAGVMCAKERTDGHVPALTVKLAAVLADTTPRKAVPSLVASGLWHDAETIAGCDRCHTGEPLRAWPGAGDLEPGAFFFHDWWHYQLNARGKNNSIEQRRDVRRKQLLRNRRLCSAIRTRDFDHCRYCGVLTVWAEGRGGDRRSDHAGTYDHLNPLDFGGGPDDDGGNSLSKVVVACHLCNSQKRDRTYQEAGMELLPEPAPYIARSKPEPNPDQTGLDPGQEFPRVTREAGPGQVGAGSASAPGVDRGLVLPGDDRFGPAAGGVR